MSDGFSVVEVDGEVNYHDEEVTVDALYEQLALQAKQLYDLRNHLQVLRTIHETEILCERA